VGLPLILLAGFLILLAPIPQLLIHGRWCLEHLGLPGGVLLTLGALGLIALAIGFVRRRVAVHRAGIVLFAVPVVGVAVHRAIATDYWRDISLLGAFLFSVILMYLTASVGTSIDEKR